MIGATSGGGVLNNYAAVAPPSATDDSSKNYQIGSTWFDTVSVLFWDCRSAAVGAAVWTARSTSAHPGFVTGRYYSTYSGVHATGIALPAADTLYVHPFRLESKVTLANLGARVFTGGASSHAKLAVWATKTATGSGFARPFGAPITNATGVDTSSSSTGVNVSVTAALNPGVYWFGLKSDGTPATYVSLSSTDYSIAGLIGRAALSGNTAITGFSVAATYATAMPTFDGTETWTEVLGGGIPVGYIGL